MQWAVLEIQGSEGAADLRSADSRGRLSHMSLVEVRS